MATLEEIIAAQEQARQAAEAARIAEAQATQPVNKGVTPALPAEGLPASGSGGVVTPLGVTTAKGMPATAKGGVGIPKDVTFAQGMPKTAQVTSVGYESPSARGAPAPPPVQTPYGPVATTNEQGQARLEQTVNPLTQEPPLTAVRASAQAYHDLPANASPEARAAAKAQYASALNESAAQRPARSVSEAFGAPQRPAEDPAKVANYNRFLQEQGINPYQIGTASMNAKGGLDVIPIAEETAINAMTSKAAKTMRDLQRIEYDARQGLKEITQAGGKGKGGKGGGGNKAEEAARSRLMEAQQATEEYGLQSGLIDPKNPTAGMNIDNARKVTQAKRALLRDPSSLAGLAQQQMTSANAKKTAEQKAELKEPTQADRQALEMAEINARQQAEALRWYEEQRRKQQEMFGGFSPYAYQG